MSGYDYFENILPEVEKLGAESFVVFLDSSLQRAFTNFIKVDDPGVKQKMITRGLSLVINIAKQYTQYGVELLDLTKEGIKGLVHAMENFEREGGFRFESYAVQCVRRSIERVILSQNKQFSFASF